MKKALVGTWTWVCPWLSTYQLHHELIMGKKPKTISLSAALLQASRPLTLQLREDKKRNDPCIWEFFEGSQSNYLVFEVGMDTIEGQSIVYELSSNRISVTPMRSFVRTPKYLRCVCRGRIDVIFLGEQISDHELLRWKCRVSTPLIPISFCILISRRALVLKRLFRRQGKHEFNIWTSLWTPFFSWKEKNLSKRKIPENGSS